MLYKILNFLFVLLEVLVIFNLIIIVHELGHFLAARWRGLVVEGFGVWFGKPLWKKKINGVTYSLGTIPAGGFVKLPQLAPMEAIEGETETPREQLPSISPLDKIIVAFAGPLFSMSLAVLFAVIVWMIGRPVSEAEGTRTIGSVLEDSPAEKAGLKAGDEILKVDGKPVTRWGGMGADCIFWRIVRSEGEKIPVEVERDGRILPPIEVTPEIPKSSIFERKGVRQIGIVPASTPMVAKILPESPADKTGLKPNDLVTEVNGQKLLTVLGIDDYAKAHPSEPLTLTVVRERQTLHLPLQPNAAKIGGIAENSPAQIAGLKKGDIITAIDNEKITSEFVALDYIHKHNTRQIAVEVLRGSEKLAFKLKAVVPASGSKDPIIGVAFEPSDGIVWDDMGLAKIIHPRPLEQVRAGVMMIVNTLGGLLSKKSDLKLQHLSGPVSIGRLYYHMFQNKDGWRMALWFSVVFNVNLALLNLLPIPVLDGGHITLALVEAVRRKPVNIRLLEIVQTACAVLVIGFMVYITYFDLSDLFGLRAKSGEIKFAKPGTEATK